LALDSEHKRVYARPSPGLKGVYARLRGLWTGVNALNDALCAGMSGRGAARRLAALMLRSRALSAFTRVFRAPWRGVSKHEGRAAAPSFETGAHAPSSG
jgi:hypothetical protein